MGLYSWDIDGGFSSPPRVRTPRLTIRCEYPKGRPTKEPPLILYAKTSDCECSAPKLLDLRMRRLMSVLPSDGSSQVVPSPGHRIRIKQIDGSVLTGTLATWSEETIRLSVDSSRVEGTIAISRSQIATLESQQGTRNKSTLIGIVGLLVGGAIAVDTRDMNDCLIGARSNLSCMGDVVGRVALGMAAGAVVGALVGSAIRTENWVIVPLIEVAPTVQGTSASEFGFGLHARVGLPW